MTNGKSNGLLPNLEILILYLALYILFADILVALSYLSLSLFHSLSLSLSSSLSFSLPNIIVKLLHSVVCVIICSCTFCVVVFGLYDVVVLL